MRLSDESISKYNSDYIRFFQYSDFEDTPINEITENTIEVFILETIKNKLCKEACKNLIMYIKKTTRHTRKEKILLENSAEFIELKDFSRFCIRTEKTLEEKQYSDEETKLMLAFLKREYIKNPSYMPNYAIELAIYTGMRIGELASLKWEDIDTDNIHICRSEKFKPRTNEYFISTTKNGKSSHFPIDDRIANLFERIKCVYLENDCLCEWVFASEGKRINKRTLTSCNKNKWKQLGGKAKSGIHGYRHRLSSNLRTKGYSATIVAAMMGHSTQTNDRHYNRNTASIEELKEIIQAEHFNLVP